MVLNDVSIIKNKTVEKTLDFDQATLRVTATNNDQPAAVAIRLTRVRDQQNVFDTSTYSTFTMHGVNTPYDVQLPPGKYQLTVTIPDSSIAPYQHTIDLTTPGQPLEAMAAFHSGALRIDVTIDGRPLKAGIHVTSSGSKNSIFETLPYIGAETPLTVKVAAGRYDLHIIPMGVDGLSERWVRDIEVKPDTVSNAKIHFSVSTTDSTADTATRTAAGGMEANTDRPGGGDFRRLTPTQDDPSQCRDACRDDNQCRAWTYVKPNTIQGPTPNCWLKTGVPPKTNNDCCVSGTK